jgi:glycosyltransferase involved in cell wall biosynthesis
VKIALVVATLGRLESLRKLLESLSSQTTGNDRLVIVAQDEKSAVDDLAESFRADTFRITVIDSARGASLGRNVGVAELPDDEDFLLVFPNDTTWFPEGTLDALRALPGDFTAGALTVVDENGPKFRLSPPGTPLDRWNVWSVIEMGLLMRRAVFDTLGGFDATIGTGAATPWQAGEATDLLLRFSAVHPDATFAWLAPDIRVGGIADARDLTAAERRRKLRRYGRGLGRLVQRHRYPLWWRVVFVGGGLAFGLRHRATNKVADGWWVFTGRLEGILGHTFGSNTENAAVTR